MVTSAELNNLTVRQLGALAKELAVSGWHEMRKDELVHSLVQKSRTKLGGVFLRKRMGSKKIAAASVVSKKGHGKTAPVKRVSAKPSAKGFKAPAARVAASPNAAKGKTVAAAKKSKSKPTEASTAPVKAAGRKKVPDNAGKARSKESSVKRDRSKSLPGGKVSPTIRPAQKGEPRGRLNLRRDISTPGATGRTDRIVLLVRDPYWLHAFWELSPKTVERAKVALGHRWYTSVPVLRLFRLETDGSTSPKRHFVRDVPIHGGVNNWYLDVLNPPAGFLVELGYLSRERKFYSIVSSNPVETPQRQIVDDLDKLDGNWRGVADDLGRIFKLSGGDGGNQELRRVFEEQLRRPMSAPLLSRYRASRQNAGSEKTKRNFVFDVDADVIIHGKTDPSVQVTIRNEPIKINADGSFSVRFSLPEKRHVFPIEAEGSDGVEMQRVILTVERNTRVLETLFQEHNEDD